MIAPALIPVKAAAAQEGHPAAAVNLRGLRPSPDQNNGSSGPLLRLERQPRRGSHVKKILTAVVVVAFAAIANAAPLAGRGLADQVVDHVHLVDGGRPDRRLGSFPVEEEQGEGGLLDLGPVEVAAPGQDDSDALGGGHVDLRKVGVEMIPKTGLRYQRL